MRFVAWRVIKGFEHKTPSEDLFKAKNIGFEIIPILKSPRINQKEELICLLYTSRCVYETGVNSKVVKIYQILDTQISIVVFGYKHLQGW